ncbi:MAG: hypothetical protein ACJ0P8_01390 [Flavobacteriales bacterium]
MKKTFILSIALFMFCFTTNAQYLTSIGKGGSSTESNTNLFTEIAMLEVEYFDNEGVFTNENITSYILGLSSNLELNKNFNLTGSLGFAEGFSYSFATSNLALKLSENFHLFYGIGGYYISDEKWNPVGLDGNEPSRYDFGMNMGLQLYLTNHLGLIMRYNIIEEKEEESIRSMSINGLSFGLIIK